jgi:hypothetical protein
MSLRPENLLGTRPIFVYMSVSGPYDHVNKQVKLMELFRYL